MSDRDYAAIARQYAGDVVRGKIPACKSIRLQCQRFLDELKVQRKRGFPFRFDEQKAARVCRFVELMPHTKGKWAAKRERLILQPWQIWILACTFGWLQKKDGLRRFRTLFVVVPRKNGKSALVAPVGLYMLCADGEFGAEVYAGAVTESQAHEVFRPAQQMAKRTPALIKKFGIAISKQAIMKIADESKFTTIIGDPGDGQSPSCSIHDEYHEHLDDRQIDTMGTGMGAREQPLQVMITTAGFNLGGPCYARIQEERQRLQGIGQSEAVQAERAALGLGTGPSFDEKTFFVEYTIDEGDDWRSPDVLRKANPNFGVSVMEDFLRGAQREAINTPRKAGKFKTKHLDIWVAAKAAYFDIEKWRACRDPNLPANAAELLQLPQLQGRRVIAALDLASKTDIAALELLFPPLGEKATKDDPYIRTGFYFLPEDTIAENENYAGWHAQGLLTSTSGNIIDYDEILTVLRDVRTRFQLEQVPYDPHQATYLATTAVKDGFPMLEYRQVVLNFSEPMKELDAVTKAVTIAHGGCPVMEWQMSNVVAQEDAKENVYPRKPRAEAKIDNPVALIAALGTAMSKENGPMESPYASRGLTVI